MKNKVIYTFSGSLLLSGLIAVTPAHANMGCPYGGSPNWQGVCDTTTDDGKSYFGPQVWIPEPETVPTTRPTPTVEPTPAGTATPDIQVEEGGVLSETDTEMSTQTNANPSVTANPVIWGNGNRVVTTVNNLNTTNSSVINNVINRVNNSSNVSKIIQVTGGYIVIGDSGAAQFLPNALGGLATDTSGTEDVSDIQYVDKEQLPAGMLRAVNRIPASVAKGDSRKLPRFLRESESITEDVCLVEDGRVDFLSRGLCVLEMPVGDALYEHEVRVTR